MYTIPTIGHARNCSELVLEGMHQVFKGWLEKNTHQTSHISAVERALARDWTGRVYALFKVWEGVAVVSVHAAKSACAGCFWGRMAWLWTSVKQ